MPRLLSLSASDLGGAGVGRDAGGGNGELAATQSTQGPINQPKEEGDGR